MPYDPSKDPNYGGGPTADPGRRIKAVTPSDTTDLTTYANALYVGTTGDVSVIAESDADAGFVVFKNVPAGAILPVQVRRVRATGTTATDIVAILS